MTSSYLNGETMRIIVGPPEATKEFTVHKDLIYEKAPILAAIQSYKKGRENTIVLKDMDPKAFDKIAKWFYTGCFPQTESDPDEEVSQLVQAYAIADSLFIDDCRENIMETVRQLHENGRHASFTDLVMLNWRKFHPSSEMGACFIDSLVDDLRGRQIEAKEKGRDYEIDPVSLKMLLQASGDYAEALIQTLVQSLGKK